MIAPTMTDRDALIISALPLVKWQATRMGRLPVGVTTDDLESAGHDALMEAATTFDPACGYEFKTAARQTVKSRMRDYIRAARRRKTVPLEVRTPDGDELPRADPRADDPAEVAAAREQVAGKRLKTPAEIAAQLPTPEAVAERVKVLRSAIFAAISAEDVQAVVQGVVYKAKFGDLKATQVLLALIGSGPEVIIHDKRKVIVTNSPPALPGKG